MRTGRILIAAGLLVITSAWTVCAQLPPNSQQATLQRFFFQQSSFEIPFAASEGIAEVRLYISSDQGATWTLHSRQTPQAGKFVFQALRDGEYWFASQTVSAANQPILQRPERAEQAIVIDTAQPRLEFQSDVSASGEVTTTFRLFDANLDPQSFRLTYSPIDVDNFATVTTNALVGPNANGEYTGEATWLPTTEAKAINVRAEVLDAAKNRIVVNRRVFLPNSAVRRLPPSIATQPQSIPSDPFNAYETTPSAEFQPIAKNVSTDQTSTQSENPPRDSVYPTTPATEDSQRQQSVVGNSWSNTSPYQPVAQEYRPSIDTQAGLPAERRGLDVSDLPPGEKPHMTKSMRFSLDYDVDAVGPAGVASVELWTTTNGGQSWKSWGYDEDRRSPFYVEVDQEGVYGFRMVIHGNNNLASPTPKSGDLADIWIGVDATKPVARITGARYGEGAQTGNLIIRWEASDSYLSERPIKLTFADSPDGPWKTIAAGLPNNGQYAWQADPNLPQQVYLRLEARDEAGNSTIYQPADPVNVQGLTPKGRIRGFHPASN